MDRSMPSRNTRAVATDMFRSDAKDRSARNSWMNPRKPLNSTMARMAAASSQSSRTPERMAAPISTQTMTLVNWERKSPRSEGGGASGSSLGPSRWNRSFASRSDKPRSKLVWSPFARASAEHEYHAPTKVKADSLFPPCTSRFTDDAPHARVLMKHAG